MTAVLNKEGFRSIIASLSGLSDGATRWALDGQSFVSDTDRAQVVLQLFSMTADVGVDEHRRALGPPGYPATSYVVTELGNRTLRITIRAEAFDNSAEAAEILDAIRTGIRMESTTAALNAINIAFVDAEAAVYVPYTVDERVVNAAIADFTFAGIAQRVSNVNADYIETVNGDNTVPGGFTP